MDEEDALNALVAAAFPNAPKEHDPYVYGFDWGKDGGTVVRGKIANGELVLCEEVTFPNPQPKETGDE